MCFFLQLVQASINLPRARVQVVAYCNITVFTNACSVRLRLRHTCKPQTYTVSRKIYKTKGDNLGTHEALILRPISETSNFWRTVRGPPRDANQNWIQVLGGGEARCGAGEMVYVAHFAPGGKCNSPRTRPIVVDPKNYIAFTKNDKSNQN